MVPKYGARRDTVRANNQRPKAELLARAHARSVGPAVVVSVMVNQSIWGRVECTSVATRAIA
jgi:hypothetical protein